MFDNLPPAIAAKMQQTIAAREAAGLNVHFVNESGVADRFSFASVERADAFKAKLIRAGRTIL